ncbi:hypothetical protein AB1N83_013064 [Pleurotus pulmonarius]
MSLRRLQVTQLSASANRGSGRNAGFHKNGLFGVRTTASNPSLRTLGPSTHPALYTQPPRRHDPQCPAMQWVPPVPQPAMSGIV